MRQRMTIVAGQSNAMGVYGGPRKFIETDADQEIGISWRHFSTSDGVVPLQLQRVRDPGPHNSGLPSHGFGPELSLARTLHATAEADERVLIVKHAVDGSNLHEQWKAPGGPLFMSLVTHVQSVRSDLTASGADVTIDGLLWVQGESDAGESAHHYEENLRRFFTGLREALPAPSMAIVVSRVHLPFAPEPGRSIVRDAQVQVAEDDANARHIDTDDLPLDRPGIHLTGEGLLELGVRAADAFIQLRAAGI